MQRRGVGRSVEILPGFPLGGPSEVQPIRNETGCDITLSRSASARVLVRLPSASRASLTNLCALTNVAHVNHRIVLV
jgi:hypothetical protein